jgi:hypothetical protein
LAIRGCNADGLSGRVNAGRVADGRRLVHIFPVEVLAALVRLGGAALNEAVI